MSTRSWVSSSTTIDAVQAWRRLRGPLAVLVVASAASVGAGLLSIATSNFAAQRPVFLLALPLAIVLLFTFLMAPKLLVAAILVLRACLDPIFLNAQLPGIGGLGGLVNLAIIGLAALLVLKEPQRVPRLVWVLWLPFMAVQLLGVAGAPDTINAVRQFLGRLATASVFLLAFQLVHDRRSFVRALQIVLASSLPVVAYTLLAIARGDSYNVLDGPSGGSARYAGPFGHPNILAFYVVLVMGVLLCLRRIREGRHSVMLSLATLAYWGLLVLLLFSTKTRSAWIAALLLFVVYGWFVERRFLLYLAAVPALALLVPEVRDRVLEIGQASAYPNSTGQNSFEWRQQMWSDALAYMQPSRYLMGYGLGSFIVHSPRFFSLSYGAAFGAHSVPVQQFFELGVAGLVSFLYLFWGSLRQIASAWRHERAVTAVFVAQVLCYLIVAFSDNMLDYLTFNWYFWFAVGAVCSLSLQPARSAQAG